MIEYEKNSLRTLVKHAQSSDDDDVKKAAMVVVDRLLDGELDTVITVADLHSMNNPEPDNVRRMKKKG